MSYSQIDENLEQITRFEACDMLCPESRTRGRELLDVYFEGMKHERILSRSTWNTLSLKEREEIQFFHFKNFVFPIRREDVSNQGLDTRGMDSKIYVEGAGEFHIDDYPFLNGVYSALIILHKFVSVLTVLTGAKNPIPITNFNLNPAGHRFLRRNLEAQKDADRFLDIYDHGDVVRTMVKGALQGKTVMVRKSLFPGMSSIRPEIFPDAEQILEMMKHRKDEQETP